MKQEITQNALELHPALCKLSDYMYHNPELGGEEIMAAEKLAELLEAHGFVVERNALEISNAFTAVYDSGIPGKSVVFLCEYDALPDIGHGCGHNMIGAMSAGAGIALSKVIGNIGGKVYVYGTPAEETNGAKVKMAAEGLFDGITAALMIHPSSKTMESGTSSAMEALQFAYSGQTAHAAGCPEKGINALNAVIQLFNGIDALRQHVTPDVRIHGIINRGGVAANIVPDDACAQFYIRAATKETLAIVKDKVLKVAEGASIMTGATLDVSNYELSYEDLKTNAPLLSSFNKNLNALGVVDISPPSKGAGSSDIGNVSNVLPTIHSYLAIVAPKNADKLIGHTREFADATITDYAHKMLLIGATALAHTGLDVLEGLTL